MEEDKTEKTNEIKNFSLSYDGMYWIRQGNEHYPVLLNPDDLVFLFEAEGLDMKVKLHELNQYKGYTFRKATLIREVNAHGGDYFDAEGNWFALYECHVKY
jgi:hypothetical protein